MSPNPIESISPDLRVRLEFVGRLAAGVHVVLVITRNGQTEKRVPIDLPPLHTLDSETTEHWRLYRQLSMSETRRSRMQWETFYEKPYESQVEECYQSADRLLSGFNRWLESVEMRPLITQLRTYLNPSDHAHFSIVASDPQIEQLPWQKWTFFHDYPHIEPALSSPQLSKCPAFDSSKRDRTLARILAVFGDGRNLDMTVDRQALEQVIRDAADRSSSGFGSGLGSNLGSNLGDTVEIEFLIAPTHAKLEDALHEQEWDILFFAGHSKTEANSGRIFINERESVTIEQLWYSLQKAADRGLRLAIFNSCQGLGIAKGLNTARIPQMVIMREAVPDQVAQDFLRYFLQGFVRQRLPLAEAVRDARQRLAHLENQHPCATWLPTLYQHPEADVLTWEQLIPSSRNVEIPARRSLDLFLGLHRRMATQRRVLILALVIALPVAWIAIVMTVQTIGNQAYERKHFALAAHAFHLQCLLMPQAAPPRYNLAQVYDQKLFDPERAIGLMQAAATRKFAMAYPEWARMLLDRGDLETAIRVIVEGFELLETLPSTTPNYAEIEAGLYTQRAWWALQLGNLDDADRDANQVLRLFPNSPKAWCVKAKVQMARGQDAREAWQHVQEQSDYRMSKQQGCLLEANQSLKEYSLEHSTEPIHEKNERNP